MDIFNINIHHITRQYLEYIKTMRRLDLEVAGEFVAMAATLLHIKSKMLLPQYNEEGEIVEHEDPRKELVQKLLEYKKIKELSGQLYALPLLGRDVFPRGEREDLSDEVVEGDLVLEDNPLFGLISAYRMAMQNMKKTVHKVAEALQSIAERIMEMKSVLVVGHRVVFRDLITAKENVSSQVLVTFLSLLELAKMGFVSVFQSEPFADIHIETKSEIDRDVVSRAENYDAVHAEAKAEEMIHTAHLALEEPAIVLEGEDETVVESVVVDAATDADIEAEERRLFTGDGVGDEGEATAVMDAPIAEATPDAVIAEESGELTASPDEDAPTAAAVEVATEVMVMDSMTERTAEAMDPDPSQDVSEPMTEDLAAAVALENAAAVESQPVEMVPSSVAQVDVAAVLEERVEFALDGAGHDFVDERPAAQEPVEPTMEAAISIETKTEAEAGAESAAPTKIEHETEASTSSVQEQKLNSALSAALSAFDAFEDIPSSPSSKPEPEVES